MLIPDYPQEGQPVSAQWGRRVVDAIKSLRLIAGLNIMIEERGTAGTAVSGKSRPTSAGAGIPWDKLCLGHTISGARVTIIGGEVQWGDNDPVVMGDTEVTITETEQYIGVQFDGTDLTVIGPNTDKTVFQSTSTVWRTWLYQFSFTDDKASLLKIGRMAGNVEIPAWFGPSV